jgi:hypothetical protein
LVDYFLNRQSFWQEAIVQRLKLHRHLIRSGIGLIISFTLLLTSCGGGGGGTSAPSPPLIQALLFSLPTGSTYPTDFSNAMVGITESSTGANITTASVTMNGVTLTYNGAPNHEQYEGIVLVNPANPVNLVVSVGGITYTASGDQFTSYPIITAPASGDSWSATNMNTVSWSGGAPLTNAVYLLGALDATDPNGGTPTFYVQPTSVNSSSIPASSLTVGNHYVFAGITTAVPIANADPNSAFVFGGFNYVPINVYTWTTRAFGTDVLRSVVWSGTKYVAVGLVGSDGVIYTSPDGITWTSQTANASSPSSLHGVAWSEAQFVAVGDNGTVRTSLDGITWTTRNSGATLYGVVWSGTQFVAVGSGGAIYTSTDGASWALQTSTTTNDLYGVTCNGATCVAVGVIGTILTSSDYGSSWSTSVPGTSGDPSLYGVAYSGNNFAVVGEGGKVLTSTNGVTWAPSSAGTNSLYSISWTGTQFVAVGYGGGIYTSLNGATWEAQTSGVIYNLYGLASSGTQILAVGDNTVLTSP